MITSGARINAGNALMRRRATACNSPFDLVTRDDITDQFFITRLRNCLPREHPRGIVSFQTLLHFRVFIRIFCATVIAQLCPNRILICALRPDLRYRINPARIRARPTPQRARYYAPCASTTAKRKISPARRTLLQLHAAAAVSAVFQFFFPSAPRQDARHESFFSAK